MQSPSLRESLVSLVRQYPVLDGGTDQSVRAVQELIERTYHRVYGECDTEWSGGRELQAEYGIGRSQILDIAKGRKWAHVDA